MKKIRICLILATLLIISLLIAGCDQAATPTEAPAEVPAEPTPAPVEEPTEEPAVEATSEPVAEPAEDEPCLIIGALHGGSSN